MATLQETKIDATSAMILPAGTTAERPGGPAGGAMRFNTTLGYTEFYNGNSWKRLTGQDEKRNHATSGVVSKNGIYTSHTWQYRPFYFDSNQSSVTDNSGDGTTWLTMKTFRATETNLMAVHFWAYIQSGTYYFAWRIRKNGSDVLFSSNYNGNKKPGTGNVHVYREFYAENMSVEKNDIITVEMISSNGDGTPQAGNGQVCYLRDLQAYYHGGKFVPSMDGTVEVLIVAGGGAGGGATTGGSYHGAGGGGGAGGVLYRSAYPVTAGTEYDIVVGRGGFGASASIGGNGINSSFDSLTAIGGGGGGRSNSGAAPTSGGSGGGGTRESNAGASGTAGQGFAGGTGGPSGGGGGGGGGASQAGRDATEQYPGRGGNGLQFSISGRPEYYGGGGAGGGGGNPNASPYYGNTGGAGGGGASGWKDSGAGIPGKSGTGGGGGGGAAITDRSDSFSAGGNGGTGVVIVRYISANYKPMICNVYTKPGGDGKWVCPPNVNQIEVLVAGGGGGGGSTGSIQAGGGGGAGGLLYDGAYPVTPGTTYNVTVGAGGARGDSGQTWDGYDGGNSSFDTITATGGGGGGGQQDRSGRSGGSGGGRSSGGGAGGAGSGTAGQGFPGGTSNYGNGGSNSPPYQCGGGGGAGGPGGNGKDNPPNVGGPGLCFTLEGYPKWYAGGGGAGMRNDRFGSDVSTGEHVFQNLGSMGGFGGGGRGGERIDSIANVAKYAGQDGEHGTGAGGGGGANSAVGQNAGYGGDGVVVIRYAAT